MNGRKKIYLHIGTHKTGSTSFQAFINDQRATLKKNGLYVYNGLFHPRNHYDVFLAAAATDLDSPPTRAHPDLDRADLRTRVKKEIADALDDPKCQSLIISTEHLSLLRSDAEIAGIKSLFDGYDVDILPILVLREKDDFLQSYKKQMEKTGHDPSQNPKSAFYVEPDTWLIRFDSIIDAYERGFGKVEVLTYNRDGIISDILARMGFHLPGADKSYFINQTAGSGAGKAKRPSWLRRKLSKTLLGRLFRTAKAGILGATLKKR